MARRSFEMVLKMHGEDFHAGNETRRGFYSDHKDTKKVSFPPMEFPLGAGDTIKRWANEENLAVLSSRMHVVAGLPICFQAVVQPKG